MNEMLNPLAKLTPIGDGSLPEPNLRNTKAGASVARYIEGDLAYIRNLGPGPLPWERAGNQENPNITPVPKPPTVGIA